LVLCHFLLWNSVGATDHGDWDQQQGDECVHQILELLSRSAATSSTLSKIYQPGKLASSSHGQKRDVSAASKQAWKGDSKWAWEREAETWSQWCRKKSVETGMGTKRVVHA
jgi:hypothetical protein